MQINVWTFLRRWKWWRGIGLPPFSYLSYESSISLDKNIKTESAIKFILMQNFTKFQQYDLWKLEIKPCVSTKSKFQKQCQKFQIKGKQLKT